MLFQAKCFAMSLFSAIFAKHNATIVSFMPKHLVLETCIMMGILLPDCVICFTKRNVLSVIEGTY